MGFVFRDQTTPTVAGPFVFKDWAHNNSPGKKGFQPGSNAPEERVISKPWKDPPPPQGVAGQVRRAGHSTGDAFGTNTAMGRVGEEAFVRIAGGHLLHPEGHGEISPLDVKIDGYGFEVKSSSTLAASYKASPKPFEITDKLAYAKSIGVKPAMSIVVLDPTRGQAHAYWRPGLATGRLSRATGWRYLGSTTLPAQTATELFKEWAHNNVPGKKGFQPRSTASPDAVRNASLDSEHEKLVSDAINGGLFGSSASERGFLVRSDGNVVQLNEDDNVVNESTFIGETGYISLEHISSDVRRDAELVHTHPDSGLGPLSDGDIVAAIHNQMSSITAISQAFTYTIRIPKGLRDAPWPLRREVANTIQTKLSKSYSMFGILLRLDPGYSKLRGPIDVKNLANSIWAREIHRYIKPFGLTLEVRPTSPRTTGPRPPLSKPYLGGFDRYIGVGTMTSANPLTISVGQPSGPMP